jgi:hypothetical protein
VDEAEGETRKWERQGKRKNERRQEEKMGEIQKGIRNSGQMMGLGSHTRSSTVNNAIFEIA